MPDITMCVNEDCEKKSKCYRFMVQPSSYQSMSNFENACVKPDRKMFLKIYKGDRLNQDLVNKFSSETK